MKSTVIIAIAFVLIFPLTVFAQESYISVQTDDNHYGEGDTIVISGSVSTIVGSTPATLQVFNEGNLVDIVQVTIAQDGSYSHTIIAEGPLWKEQGEFTARVSYGEGNIAETQFTFSPKLDSHETTSNFEVDAGNHGTFDVKYSILGGTVNDIVINANNFAMIVQISSRDEGYLTIEIPRAVIGAEKQNGDDDKFIVLIDGIQVPYSQTDWDFISRVIKVNFDQGDSEIEIFGTYLFENQPRISEPVEDGWTSIDDLPTINEDEDPDVEISRLKQEIKDLKIENKELKEQIKDMKQIVMEQIRVIMKWFS